MFLKMYAQMMQQVTGKEARTSASSQDPLVASSPNGAFSPASSGIAATRADPGGKKKGAGGAQRMSQVLRNKLMMTNPLAFNMFNRGAVPEEEEEEESGPLQSGTMELMPYMPGNGSNYGSGSSYTEPLRTKYGMQEGTDPTVDLHWQNQGQQRGWNPKGLLALPAPASSLATQESDIALQFDQFGSPGFAQSQNAMYQQKLKQQQQLKQQRLLQQQQQQQQVATDQDMIPAGQSQMGSTGFAQSQNAMYQQRLQKQKMQQQQQQQLPRQQQLQLQAPAEDESVSEARYGENADSSMYSQQQMMPQQQQQQQQQQYSATGQFGSAGYAQSQTVLYQQNLMQQRQKKLQQQQQQQQRQQLQAQGSRQEAGMEGAQSNFSYAQSQNPLYEQQLQQQQQAQAQQVRLQQQPLNSPAGQLGSAQYAQTQAAMYQQKLQQLKQRQNQQQLPQQRQSQQPGMNQLPTTSQLRSAASPAAGEAASVGGASAVTQGQDEQMGSVGYALAQNARYQQQLQQQQMRRQQRISQAPALPSQQKQMQMQQQMPRQLPQLQQSMQASPSKPGPSSEVRPARVAFSWRRKVYCLYCFLCFDFLLCAPVSVRTDVTNLSHDSCHQPCPVDIHDKALSITTFRV